MLERLRRRSKELEIAASFWPEGVLYTCRLRAWGTSRPRPITLPVDPGLVPRLWRQAEAGRLALLLSLWADEVLLRPPAAEPGQYLLPAEAVYALDPVDRRVLRLPEPEAVLISLQSRGAVGQRHFGIVAEVRHPQRGLVHRLARRAGPFYLFPDGQVLLLPPAVARLLDAVDQAPAEIAGQPEYVARVKAAAREAGAQLDPYLAREEYYLVTEVDLEPELRAPDHLLLHPRFRGLPPEVEAAVQERPQEAEAGFVTLGDGRGGRRRVFLPPGARQVVRHWRARPEIRGADVPRFVENPAPFLPEAVDLSRFSERVKGLGLRIYRVHPYLSARKSSRGWLFEPGVRWEPVAGGGAPVDGGGSPLDGGGSPLDGGGPPLDGRGSALDGRGSALDGGGSPLHDGGSPLHDGGSPLDGGGSPLDGGGSPLDGGGSPLDGRGSALDGRGSPPDGGGPADVDQELAALLTAAGEAGGYVRQGDVWVHAPPGAGAFLAANRRFRQECPDGVVDPVRLSYVLEINTNIEALEYSPELVAYRAGAAAEEDGTQPPGFKTELRPHQREGLRWLKRLHRQRLGGLLADDMGLGKTVQVLALMMHLHERGELRPSLVVVPRAVRENWQAELERFCPGLRPYEHGGAGRTRSPEVLARYDVVFTTYETLARDQFWMGQVDWRLVVLDEAQKIKNMTALATHAAKALKARTRLALTGTPVENSLGELWSIVDYAQPGLLGSYQDFRRRFELPLQAAGAGGPGGGGGAGPAAGPRQLERELAWEIAPVTLRRTKAEHLRDQLPGKEEHRVEVALGREQWQLYRQILNEVRGQRGAALGAVQRLLQVCCHPALEGERWAELSPEALQKEVPKLEKTLEILEGIAGAGEKAVLVTHWRGMQQILQQVIRERFRVHAPIINGEAGNRKAVVDWFCALPGFQVLILSPKAGGVGLNVVCANHVIHYSRWWNPAVENQATDRVYRMGQTRPVHVYFPVVTAPEGRTVEQILDELLAEKRALADGVLIPSSALEVSPAAVAARLGLSECSP